MNDCDGHSLTAGHYLIYLATDDLGVPAQDPTHLSVLISPGVPITVTH